MKISEIKELIQLVNDTEIGELEIESEDYRLILKKSDTLVQSMQYQPGSQLNILPQLQPTCEGTPTAVATAPTSASAEREVKHKVGKPLNSPMVGTFYRSPRPGADSFVKVGDRVKVSQTLCIIEAMKLMNEIEAEFAGKILDILVEDGQPVQYGQTLFLIDPEQ